MATHLPLEKQKSRVRMKVWSTNMPSSQRRPCGFREGLWGLGPKTNAQGGVPRTPGVQAQDDSGRVRGGLVIGDV